MRRSGLISPSSSSSSGLWSSALGLTAAVFLGLSGAASVNADELAVSAGVSGRQTQPALVRLGPDHVWSIWENDRLGIVGRSLDAEGVPSAELLRLVPNSAALPVPGEGEYVMARQPAAVRNDDGQVHVFFTEERYWIKVDIFWEERRLLERTVFSQTFDEQGEPVGPRRRWGSTAIDDHEGGAAVVALGPSDAEAAGAARFALAFESAGPTRDSERSGLFVQRFSEDGGPVGDALRVSGRGGSSTRRPALAAAADGGFLVAWESWGDGDEIGVFARLIAADGTPAGPARRVNEVFAGSQFQAAVAAWGDGFLVAWTGQTGEKLRTRIFARFLDAAAKPHGSEFALSPGKGEYESAPSLLAARDGQSARAAWLRWNASYPVAVEWVGLNEESAQPTGASQNVSETRPGALGRLQFLEHTDRGWIGSWHGIERKGKGLGIKVSRLEGVED